MNLNYLQKREEEDLHWECLKGVVLEVELRQTEKKAMISGKIIKKSKKIEKSKIKEKSTEIVAYHPLRWRNE